jgi:hypothetical protein
MTNLTRSDAAAVREAIEQLEHQVSEFDYHLSLCAPLDQKDREEQVQS